MNPTQGVGGPLGDEQFWNDIVRGLWQAGHGAARGISADVLGSPVDALNQVLGIIGLASEVPVGGSKWIGNKMEKMGILEPASGTAPETAGRIFGAIMADPQAIADVGVRGKQLGGLLDEVIGKYHQKMIPNVVTYHGSPHTFDSFKAEKIGTGEGAQAYGYGHYLAENPATAKTYAGMSKTHAVNPDSAYVAAAKDSLSHGLDPAPILKAAYRNITPQEIEAAIIEAKGGFKPNLYTVDLPDSAVAKMLDWDKPLSQQPVDSSGLISYINKRAAEQGRGRIASVNMTGQEAHRALTAVLPSESRVSEKLSEFGFPGIKYLDQGSRAAGVGTHNYVVFPGNENLMKILERK